MNAISVILWLSIIWWYNPDGSLGGSELAQLKTHEECHQMRVDLRRQGYHTSPCTPVELTANMFGLN